MKILITILFLICPSILFAYEIPDQIVDAGILQSKAVIDADNQQLVDLQNKVRQINESFAGYQVQLTQVQAQIDSINADIDLNKQSVTTLANATPPVQSAVDLCNATPDYCINWTAPTP